MCYVGCLLLGWLKIPGLLHFSSQPYGTMSQFQKHGITQLIFFFKFGHYTGILKFLGFPRFLLKMIKFQAFSRSGMVNCKIKWFPTSEQNHDL